MGARHNLNVFGKYSLLHLKTAMEYRINFFVQSVFMIINDTLWLAIWFFMFSAFETVNGYRFEDAVVVFAIVAISFGLARTFFGRGSELWEDIIEGKFDFYLGFPIDELFHGLMSKSSFHAIGDIGFGILMTLIVVPNKIWLVLAVSIPSMMVLLGFFILIDTLGFYFMRPGRVTKSALNVLVAFSAWPIDAFTPIARAILYAIPVAFIGMVPYHIVMSFTWAHIWPMIAVAFTVLGLSILLFKYGMHKYESGNLVTTRS